MKTLRLLLISLFAATSASPLFALPSNEVERVYYSDATYTQEVGYETIMTCYGRPHFPTLEGQRTRFAKSFSTPCNSRDLMENTDRDVQLDVAE